MTFARIGGILLALVFVSRPAAAEDNLKLATEALDAKNYQLAAKYYTAVIAELPKSPSGYCLRGYCYSELKDFKAAIADFNRAIEVDPKYLTSFGWRGRCYLFDLKEYDKAKDDFSIQIFLTPKDGDAFYYRAKAYDKKEDYGKALADLNEAIRLDPKDVYKYRLRALIYQYNFQDYDKAIADYSKVAEIGPLSSDLSALGALHARMEDFASAIRWQKKAIDMAPESEKQPLQVELKKYEAEANDPFRKEMGPPIKGIRDLPPPPPRVLKK